jgi:hypothetical protein
MIEVILKKDRGQAHLPNLELHSPELPLLNLKGSQAMSLKVEAGGLRVGKAGSPPLLVCLPLCEEERDDRRIDQTEN